MTVIELKYRFKKGEDSEDIVIRLFDVRQARGDDSPAPWDIGVTIKWGDKTAFDHPLSGADPLHAVEMAVRFATRYLGGRAHDEGGTLEPPIAPP